MTDQWPLRITLPGEPIGKGRPRVKVVAYGVKRPFPQVYADPKTKSHEKALAMLAVAAMRGRAPILGAVSLSVTAYMGIPKSWSERKWRSALDCVIRPTG